MRVRDILAQLKHADPDGLVTFYTHGVLEDITALAVDSLSLNGKDVVLSMDNIDSVRRRTEIEADKFRFHPPIQGIVKGPLA